jgi:hypothetical protein
MIWAIAIIISMTTTNVTYVGQFEQEAACNKAVQDLRSQNLSSIKAVCVQISKPAEAAKK